MTDRGERAAGAPTGSLPSWVFSFLSRYRWPVVALAALSVAEIGFGALAPWPMKAVVDNVLGGQPLPAWLERIVAPVAGGDRLRLLFLIVFGGLLLQITSQITSLFHTQVQVSTGQKMVLALRRRLFETLQGLPLKHHVVTNTGDAVFRLEADAYCIDDLVMKGVFPLASAVTTLAVMFTVLLRIDAVIALLTLGVVPFLYASLRYYMRHMVARAEAVKERESKLVERLYETFSAIKLVKSFAREAYELARFSTFAEGTMAARVRLTWQESLFSVVVGAITLTGTAGVVFYGADAALEGRMTVGQLLVVIAYLQSIFGPLSSIAHTTGSLQQAVASARRVRHMFTLASENDDVPDARDARGIAGVVRFDNVGFAYDPSRPVLDGIDFEARPGQMIAIVGLTGAGKTTLVSLIPRFYRATRGSVTIDGVDVSQYKLRSLREQIGVVLQEPVLFSGTIADNLRYGKLDATDAEVEAAARAAHAHEFIARLPQGYQTDVAEAGATLSGGERQRLSVARALLKDARILILDEPTSSLDAISEEIVFKAIRRLRAGRTTLVIAHRLSTVRDADCILVLDGGRLAAKGTHEHLLATSTLYRRMCARLSVGRSLDEPETVDELLEATP